MAEFSSLNARLTQACKTSLGELVDVTLESGKQLTGLRAIVDRDREIVGTNGQVSDMRVTAKFAVVDFAAGDELDNATVYLREDAATMVCEAILANDGQFAEWALR